MDAVGTNNKQTPLSITFLVRAIARCIAIMIELQEMLRLCKNARNFNVQKKFQGVKTLSSLDSSRIKRVMSADHE
jgi:hypothetical protein